MKWLEIKTVTKMEQKWKLSRSKTTWIQTRIRGITREYWVYQLISAQIGIYNSQLTVDR